MITFKSGRDSIIIWISVCTGAIAQYFIKDLCVIIIVVSVFCTVTSLYIYLKKETMIIQR
jgi:hypothetical protein